MQDVLGYALPTFGRDLFSHGPATFTPATDIPAPANYVLGPEDEIRIRIWGKIEADVNLTVDRNGQIFLPHVGTLMVAGLRSDQLTGFIHNALAQQYKDFELTVNLGQLRSIQVYVLGEARQPGVYTISSLSTLTTALFASGGPSATGTVRDIQVKRAGRIITHLDVYRLLGKGDDSDDVSLLAGDIIYIPEIGPQIAVAGDVNKRAVFELKGEQTVASVLAEAGGLTATAGTARAVLERVDDHRVREIKDLALDAAGRATVLRDGDILRVLSISARIENAVTIKGNVAAPGRYMWHAGMHVSDLILSRDFLLARSWFNRQNAPLEGSGDHAFRADGPNASPAAAGGHETEINWNYAVIQRLSASDLTTELLPFALGAAIAQPGSAEDKELKPGDVVVVYSAHDVELPQTLRAKYVKIDGQVRAPGVYRVNQGETLCELVSRAGGLSDHAYLYAAQLTRESVRVEQLSELHAFTERISREVLSPTNLPRTSALDRSDPGSELALRQAYIAKLSEVHPTGRIVLQMKPGASSASDVPDFLLEDGDHFFVPSIPNTINVLGSVYNEGAFRFVGGEHMLRYLNESGGATREADRGREFILRADGTLVSRQADRHFEQLEIFPGDTVVVPPRLRSHSIGLSLLDSSQVISSAALSAIAIHAIQ